MENRCLSPQGGFASSAKAGGAGGSHSLLSHHPPSKQVCSLPSPPSSPPPNLPPRLHLSPTHLISTPLALPLTTPTLISQSSHFTCSLVVVVCMCLCGGDGKGVEGRDYSSHALAPRHTRTKSSHTNCLSLPPSLSLLVPHPFLTLSLSHPPTPTPPGWCFRQGELLVVEIEGQLYEVAPPEGLRANDTFEVYLPSPAPPAPSCDSKPRRRRLEPVAGGAGGNPPTGELTPSRRAQQRRVGG